jgi:acyl-CoA thioesterase FadM
LLKTIDLTLKYLTFTFTLLLSPARMNLLFRMIAVLLSGFFSKTRTSIMDVHAVWFTVLPNDLDTNLHMNNGRYLTIMDLGRVDALIRSGLVKKIISEKWMPVIAGVSMIYRRSLAPFERYRLETHLLGWDEKWIYMEQTFIRKNGDVAARGYVKATFLQRGQRVATADIAVAANYSGASPDLNADILALFPKAI